MDLYEIIYNMCCVLKYEVVTFTLMEVCTQGVLSSSYILGGNSLILVHIKEGLGNAIHSEATLSSVISKLKTHRFREV